MNQSLVNRVRLLVASVGILFVMVLFSACSGGAIIGTSGPNGSTQVTGSVVSVNSQAHSVTLNVNGQQITVTGLTDTQIQALQTQTGKQYTIQVSSAGTNTYAINAGTDPLENDNGTPSITTQNTSNTQVGEIEFIGAVQSSTASSVTVRTPDGQTLQMNIVNGQSDLSDLNGVVPGVGQLVQVKAVTNPDGSFMISKLDAPKADDLQKQNIVTYTGMTISAVGADNKLNFKVGNKSFSYQIGIGADLKDFNNNAQSVSSNVMVKADVQFNGSTGTVTSISNAND